MNEIPQQPAISGLADNAVLNWAMQHWLLVLIAIVLLLLLLFFVVIPLFFKIFHKGKMVKETSDLKKDLLVWKNLASLVQGGEKGQEARESLSGQLKMIRILLRQGIAMLRGSRKKLYDLPWFILLGEPRSGKSALLADSGLELVCSAAEDPDPSGKKTSLPVRCWQGAHAFVLDVAGRVFFDRWLEGSSAEWTCLTRLLTRLHHRRPLDGILLAIPVDALLSDDETLTKQKASLMASELQHLLMRTGQTLTCQVIVTKADMLLGFREYFADMDETAAQQVFGWQNPASDGKFDNASFRQYWDGTVSNLRDGSGPQMLDRSFFQNREVSAARLNACGRIYLFPDSFDALRRNLEFYLNNLFGKESWRGNDQLRMGGVYFTSAEDCGVVLSDGFASLCGAKIESSPITNPPLPEKRSRFLRSLLSEVVFGTPHMAEFTGREQLKRDIPGYLLCLAIVACGVGWLSAAWLNSNRLRQDLTPLTEYYNNLGGMFQRGDILNSPLVAINDKGEAELLSDEEMAGESRYTRLQFFYDARNKAHYPVTAPIGFQTAALLTFGWHRNLGHAYRHYLFNQVQTRMVYLPAVEAVEKKIETCDNEPFGERKREAMFQFARIVFSMHPDLKNYTPLEPFLQYLLPGLNVDTLELLSAYDPDFNWASSDSAAKIVYDYHYPQVQRKWFRQFFDAWNKLEIYDRSLYPLVRNTLRRGVDFRDRQTEIEALAEKLIASAPGNADHLAAWRKARETQRKDTVQLDTVIQQIMADHEFPLAQLPDQFESKEGKFKKPDPKKFYSLNLMEKGIDNYKSRLERDKKHINRYIDASRNLVQKPENASMFWVEQKVSDAEFAIVQQNLQKEITELQKQYDSLRGSRLFNFPKQNEKNESEPLDFTNLLIYRVIGSLNAFADRMTAPEPLKKMEDFISLWTKQEERQAKISAEFESFAKRYSEEPGTASAIVANRKILARLSEYNRFLLAKNLLDFFSGTTSEFAAKINAGAGRAAGLDISPNLAGESIGKLNVIDHFNQGAVQPYLTTYAKLIEVAAADKKNKTEPLTAALPNFPAVSQAIEDYLDDYIDYWGGFPDSVQYVPSDWTAFRQFCAKVKPYQVNTLLVLLCKESSSILNRIPESILSETQKQKRKTYLAVLNDRLQILTPHFSEICIRQVSAWSALPDKAAEAFRFLGDMPRKTLQSDYLAVVATNAKGDIPWWSNFFRNGADLLKKQAGEEFLVPFVKNTSSMLRFPLCADSLDSGVISSEELQDINSMLKRIGFLPNRPDGDVPAAEAPKKDTNPAAPPISFQALDLAEDLGPTEQAWGQRFLTICDALLEKRKPLVWTLDLPNAAQRKKLGKSLYPDLPEASVRYRYWELWRAGKQIGERMQTESPDTKSLRGEAADGDLEFRFFAFAGDRTPSAVLRFPGSWAILRIYLIRGGYYDPEKKTLQAPLTVRDKYDAPSLFWVALRFNKQLPEPENWPSLSNWPDFSGVQNGLSEKRASAPVNWMRLVESCKTYDTLKKQLLDFDHVDYPRLEIILPEQKQLSPLLLKYRYVELEVPGEKTIRAAIGPVARSLGRVALTQPRLQFRFYEHSVDSVPALVLDVPGPYAPLRLLTTERREFRKNAWRIAYPVRAGETLPLDLVLYR